MNKQEDTKNVFSNIHSQMNKDADISNRLAKLLTPEFLSVEEDFFKGKVCLDAGCGVTCRAVLSMLNYEAAKVFGLDLHEPAQITDHMARFGERFEYTQGSVLELPYESGYFNFVHCDGTLNALGDKKEFEKSFAELTRVLKSGGKLFIGSLVGKGGVLTEITDFLRKKYHKDRAFKEFFDNLSYEQIAGKVEWIVKSIKSNGMDDNCNLREWFDNDMVLTIKDRLQPPHYLRFDYDEVAALFNKYGYCNLKRLSRFPIYKNVRKYLSPMYYDYSDNLAQFLYGNGQIQIIAEKKGD